MNQGLHSANLRHEAAAESLQAVAASAPDPAEGAAAPAVSADPPSASSDPPPWVAEPPTACSAALESAPAEPQPAIGTPRASAAANRKPAPHVVFIPSTRSGPSPSCAKNNLGGLAVTGARGRRRERGRTALPRDVAGSAR